MRENEKVQELLKGSHPEIFIHQQKGSPYSVLSGAFISKSPLQNTKKTKTNTITIGAN